MLLLIELAELAAADVAVACSAEAADVPAGATGDETLLDAAPAALIETGTKVAVTLLSADIVTMHLLPLTLSHPVQPAKAESALAAEDSITVVPWVNVQI